MIVTQQAMPKVFEYSKINTFFSSLGLYHFCEYMFKLTFKTVKEKDITWNDFLINYSIEYGGAMSICLIEYTTRQYLIGYYAGQIKEVQNMGWFA